MLRPIRRENPAIVAVLEEAFYLRMFVHGADMHKLSTMPDGIAKASDCIITAAI